MTKYVDGIISRLQQQKRHQRQQVSTHTNYFLFSEMKKKKKKMSPERGNVRWCQLVDNNFLCETQKHAWIEMTENVNNNQQMWHTLNLKIVKGNDNDRTRSNNGPEKFSKSFQQLHLSINFTRFSIFNVIVCCISVFCVLYDAVCHMCLCVFNKHYSPYEISFRNCRVTKTNSSEHWIWKEKERETRNNEIATAHRVRTITGSRLFIIFSKLNYVSFSMLKRQKKGRTRRGSNREEKKKK